jgi:hypothetical protein
MTNWQIVKKVQDVTGQQEPACGRALALVWSLLEGFITREEAEAELASLGVDAPRLLEEVAA